MQSCALQKQSLVYRAVQLTKQEETRNKAQEKGWELTEEEGIGRKVQDRSCVAGICVILLTPSTPIHTLRWCMKIHLCYEPGGKMSPKKRWRDKQRVERKISAGSVWAKLVVQYQWALHFIVSEGNGWGQFSLEFSVVGRSAISRLSWWQSDRWVNRCLPLDWHRYRGVPHHPLAA